MNILMIGTTDVVGGAAKISWQLRKYLESQGHTVSMFVADKKSDDPKVKIIPRSFIRKLIGFILSTENLIRTDWILDTEEFKQADVVHCHNLHGRFFNLHTLQKMSRMKPVVWTLHDEWAITPHCACTLEGTTMKNGLYVCPSKDTPPRILWDNTARLSAEKNAAYAKSKLTIITPSKWLENRVHTTSLGIQKVIRIPNGIDTTLFSPGDKIEARKKLDLPQNKKILLFLADSARINPWKGWPYAEEVILSFSKDPNIVFVCVGDHASLPSQSNIINREYIKDQSEISNYYRAADGLLFTSLAENFPLVILEAMSCGLPIVSFKVGGVPEIVEHMISGYIGEYRNSEDLKKGVEWLFSLSSNDARNMSLKNSQKIKDEYDHQTMYKKYMEVYKLACGKIGR